MIIKSFHFLLSLCILLQIGSTSTSYGAELGDTLLGHRSMLLESVVLKETRVINIWMPPSEVGSELALPVLYMADGGVAEDFTHMAITLSELIASKQIPPMILVGIENTQRRRDLTGVTEVEKDREIAPVVGGSEQFRAFISGELIPVIEREYRTTDKRGIIGESLSGLFVMETLMLTPELFTYYIALDPSLWWNDQYWVKHGRMVLEKIPLGQQKVLYFAASSQSEIKRDAKNLAKNLKGIDSQKLKWTFVKKPKETHGSIFLAAKVEALIWTFQL